MSFFKKFENSLNPPPVPQSSHPGSSQQSLNSQQPQQQQEHAPRFFNLKDGDTVHQRMFLLHGGAGPEGREYDASVVVYHHMNSFPAQRFQVADGFFKAMVHLEPGLNNLRVTYEPPGGGGGGTPLETRLNVTYIPLTQDPPVHLVLILGKDSKGEFDSPRYKREKEGNSLDVAIKKMRMAGYMFSMFCSEQMYRNGFGHRTFRLHEEWGQDTLSNRETHRVARSTAKVHIVRSSKTVAEIRDPNVAQQNSSATEKNNLWNWALDDIKKAGGVFDNRHTCHVGAVYVDGHWDKDRKLIVGHAALGGGYGNIRLGIFGGHPLYTWPTCIEDVYPCFMDATPTDTNEVANDSDNYGTSWENCNVGQGAFMHEIGHMLGCPHQPSGVMLKDYVTWNRSFMVRESPTCARTGRPGLRLTLPKDECGWHRLDTLRFRFHPAFRLPQDPPPPQEASKPNLYPVEQGAFVRSSTGVYLIELHVDGSPRAQLEYVDQPQYEIFLTEDELRAQLPPQYRDPNKKIKLEILSVGEQQTGIDDFGDLLKKGRYSANGNVMTYRSNTLGGWQGEEQVCEFPQRGMPIRSIKVNSGNALDGMEFIFADGSSRRWGKQGGSAREFVFNAGEQLVGFNVRNGVWIDGIQIITNQRRSQMYGKQDGGSSHEFIPPSGYYIHGVYGLVSSWCISFGLIYCE